MFQQTVILSFLKDNDKLTFIKDFDELDGRKVIFVAPKNGIYTVKNLANFVTEISNEYFPDYKITLPYRTREGNFVFGELHDIDQCIKIVIVPDSQVLAFMDEINYVTISCFSVFMYGFFQNIAKHFLAH